jgi:hypothetical protein
VKSKPTDYAEQNRVITGPLKSDSSYGNNGCFVFCVKGQYLTAIVSDMDGWDHVSVSLNKARCPTWAEMCEVKDIFFEPEECVIQYHPPASKYVNNHPYCLHMWRPQNHTLPEPPGWMVGYKELNDKIVLK